jgi:hypothetical protein
VKYGWKGPFSEIEISAAALSATTAEQQRQKG